MGKAAHWRRRSTLSALGVMLAMLAPVLLAARASADTAESINSLPVLDALNRVESHLSNEGKWSAVAWATNSSGHATGRDTETGWAPNDAFSAVNGAYWNQSTFSDANGSAAVITMQTGPTSERYVSLWLDMVNPGSSKSGYQLRWTGLTTANTYKITLSKWSSGTQTVLAQQASTAIPAGTTLAISDTGSTVEAWKSSGGALTSILSASDASFASGYAGVDGAGNLTRSRDFKAGALLSPPNTTISDGPSGVVVPDLTFSFTASDPSASFECSLDNGSYSACSPPKFYQGLTSGPHTFTVRATNGAGPDETPAEHSFQVVQTSEAIAKILGLDNFERQESPLASGSWSELSWSGKIGNVACCGSSIGYGSGGGLAGAYWSATSLTDSGETVLTSGIIEAGSLEEGEYLALWLNMPNPAESRSGYEARFTGISGSPGYYNVELSRWTSGSRVVLSTESAFPLALGSTVALSETAGGSLSVWAGAASISSVLTANDSTYDAGYVGLEVSGPEGRISDFRAGRIDIQPPDTTIQSGPSGIVSPQDVSFGFSATEANSRFECSLDGEPYSACSSPQVYSSLAAGSHDFQVRAIDAVDNEDETPAERSFEVAAPPTASTSPATEVGTSEAILQGSVNPSGIKASYQFEYGLTSAYGKAVPAAPKNVGPGSQAAAVHQTVAGLEPNTIYHYRITATSGAGTAQGSDETFTTASPAPVQILAFGQAAEASAEALVSAQAPLSVSAGQEGGKVEEFELRVDGNAEATVTRQEAFEQNGSEACFEGICTLSFEFPSLFQPDVAPGQHSFEVIASGAAGETATITRQVLVDSGIPALELSGSLVEANGNLPSSYSSATVSAKASDGSGTDDSGVNAIEFYVDGALESKMSAQCGGGCPAETAAEYEYTQQDWGTGPHELTVVAFDAAGNEVSTNLMVNQHLETIEPTCPTPQVTTAAPGQVVSTAEATEVIEATLPATVEPAIIDPKAPGFKVLGAPKVSPDGSKIVFNGCSLVSFECGAVVTNASGEEGSLIVATESFTNETLAAFSSSGSRLIYEKGVITEPNSSNPCCEERQIYSIKLNGTDERQLTDFSDLYLLQRPFETWEVQGTFNYSAVAADPTSKTLILEYPLGVGAIQEGQEKVKRNEPTNLSGEVPGAYPAINPSGTKIAFSSNGRGIYVMDRDGSDKKLIVRSPLAAEQRGERTIYPAFSPDGSEIAYLRNGQIYRVSADGGPSTLAVESDTSGVRTLAAAVANSDPDLTHLPLIEAAETAVLASSSSSSDPVSEGLEVVEAMNRWEIEFCITHLGECKAFADDRDLALNGRGALFTNRYVRDRSTRGNAFQHGFWTALMVRDSQDEYEGIPNGLLFALHHETKPYSWDARQDIVNDFVGYFWFIKDGIEEVSEHEFGYVSELKVCEGLLTKGKNAIFIGGGMNPFWWIHHQYEFGRLIFRKLRSRNGDGPKVWPNGRTCAEVWQAIS
jgi:WD40 repeat protein